MSGIRALVDRFQALEPRTRRLLFFAVAAASIIIFGLLSAEPSESVSPNPKATSRSVAAGDVSGLVSQPHIYVHIAGAVLHPGVYSLDSDARVFDAIFEAGGFKKGADQASVNLARTISDGEQIIVLKRSDENPLAGMTSAQGASTAGGVGAASARINLNRADLSALDTLPGIGPTLAQRIIDWRAANGGFKRIEDLNQVAGIGDALMGNLRQLVTL